MDKFVLHGENNSASRNKLTLLVKSFKKKGFEIITLDGQKTQRGELLTSFRSRSLLSQDICIVVENFLSSSRVDFKFIEKLITYDTPFIFWEKKQLSKASVEKLRHLGLEVDEFRIPSVVFKFLDSLAPGNAKVALRLLKLAKTKDAQEFLLFMLARQVRLLLWVKLDPESLKVPVWQKQKLIRQAKLWTVEKLLELNKKLLVLDRKNKTSGLALDVYSSLDLIIAST